MRPSLAPAPQALTLGVYAPARALALKRWLAEQYSLLTTGKDCSNEPCSAGRIQDFAPALCAATF